MSVDGAEKCEMKQKNAWEIKVNNFHDHDNDAKIAIER